MCAISGSFNFNKLIDLYHLNSYRGEITSSITLFDNYSRVLAATQFNSPLPTSLKEDSTFVEQDYSEKSVYFVTHSQAPTTQADNSNIHPAKFNEYLLWHNGIIKEDSIIQMNLELQTNHTWDTQLLLEYIVQYGFEALSRVDGSFACVLYNHKEEKLYVFRNQISPLFYDINLNLSSTKFENSKPLPAEKVFEIDLYYSALEDTNIKFNTKQNPYFFGVTK